MPPQIPRCTQEEHLVLEALYLALEGQKIDWVRFFETFSAELSELRTMEGILTNASYSSNVATLLLNFFEANARQVENSAGQRKKI